MTLVAHLLMNFASAEARICCILSINLFPHSNILLVIMSKSLCKESSVSAIEMLSQMSRFGVIAACSRFTRNHMSANLLMTGFSKPFGLLICV